MKSDNKLSAMNVVALMGSFGSFKGLCRAILTTQGFEDIPDEEVDLFFDNLSEEELDDVYSSVFTMKTEIEEIYTELEEFLRLKDV